MDKFMEECNKIASSGTLDEFARKLAKDKKETNSHINKFVDNMSYLNMDADSKDILKQPVSKSFLNGNI